MRRYETVWVVNGDLPDEDVKAAIDKFTKIISGTGGTVVNVEEWGRRKLAYKIGNTLRGAYILVDFAGMPTTVKELERNFRIDDRVIRYLTTKKSDHVDLAALEAEITAKAQEAAQRRAEAEKAAAPEPVGEAPAAPTPEAAPSEAETTTPAAETAEAETAEIPVQEA